MESLDKLYEQYYCVIANIQENQDNGVVVDLLQYGMTENYFNEVLKASGLLQNFYSKYLKDRNIRNAVCEKLIDDHEENVKFCVLVDVMRCYDGMDHPTSVTTPEGMALMILLGKVLGFGEINSFAQLEMVNSATLSLIDLIPYIGACSDELGKKYSLFMSSILETEASGIDRLYRMLLYNLCKKIAEVDGEISVSEQEWLNEIALLNDDDPNNDIDVSGL